MTSRLARDLTFGDPRWVEAWASLDSRLQAVLSGAGLNDPYMWGELLDDLDLVMASVTGPVY